MRVRKSWLLVVALALTTFGLSSDEADALALMIWPPSGYTGYITYIENGELDPTAPNPDVPGCFQYNCSGDYFHTEIMDRDLTEVAALEAQAKQFFVGEFGVDVDDPANMGKLFFRRYYRDPRTNTRAYVMSGTVVPNRGWQVHEGGWMVVFLEDFPLGGDHVGETANAGQSIDWGEQVIEMTRGRRHRVVGEVVLSFRSDRVHARAPNGLHVCHCQLFAGRLEDTGGGWGDYEFAHQGTYDYVRTEPTKGEEPGELRVNARHTLTFSPLGGL